MHLHFTPSLLKFCVYTSFLCYIPYFWLWSSWNVRQNTKIFSRKVLSAWCKWGVVCSMSKIKIIWSATYFTIFVVFSHSARNIICCCLKPFNFFRRTISLHFFLSFFSALSIWIICWDSLGRSAMTHSRSLYIIFWPRPRVCHLRGFHILMDGLKTTDA